MNEIQVFGIKGLPEIKGGDNLAEQMIDALHRRNHRLIENDIVVVTSKIVSKAENRFVRKQDVSPSPFAREIAAKMRNKSAEEVEVILQESSRVVKMTDYVLIMETKHGFICANAGVDRSNVGSEELFLLLPEDPDASAKQIRDGLIAHYGVDMVVIISDTFGRPWRLGQTNVAIGVSGMLSIKDYKGQLDRFGHELHMTEIAVADQLAGTAELVMNKKDAVPVAVIRGYPYPKGEGKAKDLIRPSSMDLFR